MLDTTVTESASERNSNLGTWPFFAVVFAITGLTQLPALLAMRGTIVTPAERLMPFVAIGAIGPMLAALVISRFEPDGAGWRSVFRPLRNWRANPAWYATALCLPGVILLLSMATLQLVSGRNVGPWLYPPSTAQAIIGMIVVSLGEEIGWRGFALPRLQNRYGPLNASLILGVLWAIWHVPVLLLAGISSLTTLLLMIPFFTAGSVVFTWIYNKNPSGPRACNTRAYGGPLKQLPPAAARQRDPAHHAYNRIRSVGGCHPARRSKIMANHSNRFLMSQRLGTVG